PYAEIKPIALFCNLVVSSVGFWNFYKAGYFDAKKVLPFAALSVPMAFIGAKVPIGKEAFTLLLGFSLAMAGLRIFFLRKDRGEGRVLSQKEWWIYGLPIGALIGFFSGLIGIGGGIFLAPILILTRWAKLKEASAAAAFFIFVNSLSGFISKFKPEVFTDHNLFILGLAALAGGVVGSSLGARRLPEIRMQQVLAGLLLFVSANLILQVL
ncbi:MAG: sulfite exporter TauE/SafE family protein, partial [Candidatus Omnitrophota bacterium]